MKYACQVEINLAIDQTVSLWENENNFSEWQDGFQSIVLLSGEHNMPKAQSLITLQQGKRKMELHETIISNNLPREKKALYEHIHTTYTQTTRFIKLEENKTLYISEVEYTQFNGFMIKILAKVFPGMFKKQSQKWMEQFKTFAEGVNRN
ncbi:MAG: SRPBCC family protein [Flavobacteriales bacterium]|nr:SRPBCC family protein [Flavobacteriales bacterium]